MDFDVDKKLESNPENAGNTRLLSSVLDQLLTNPYDVELQRPEFEYHEDDYRLNKFYHYFLID